MFQSVKKIVDPNGENSPEVFISDFEQAAFGAARDVFPVQPQGCLFHLGQSIDRKVGELGILPHYMTDESFRVRTEALAALAFLPPGHVHEAFDELRDKFLPWEGRLVDYFYHTYIGERVGDQVVGALFPVNIWGVYVRREHGALRTNNAVESFHNALKSGLARCSHPSV